MGYGYQELRLITVKIQPYDKNTKIYRYSTQRGVSLPPLARNYMAVIYDKDILANIEK